MTVNRPRRRALALATGSLILAGLNRAIAQSESRPPRVVLLLAGSTKTEPETVEHFRSALREFGYVDGQNLILDIRGIEGRVDQLPALIQDVLRADPKIIVASGSQTIAAARAATSTVAIVAQTVGEPVEQGFAKSLSAPGGNVTGNALIQEVSDVKTVEIVRDLLPRASRIVFLINPTNPTTASVQKRYQSSAAKLGFTASFLEASSAEDLPKAFAKLPALRADAMVVGNDAIFRFNRKSILELVARHRLPAVYGTTDFVVDGGLLSYSYDRKQMVRNAAAFVDRILKGRKPADLPFEHPTRFELAINLRTAKAVGLTIPQSILLRAALVVE